MKLPGLRLDAEMMRILAMHSYSRPQVASSSDAARPYRVDGRGELLRCSNQGDYPHCAAYALAGAVEQARLRWLDKADQLNPTPIYDEAKRIDNLPGDGTTLEAVYRAGADLTWYDKAKLETAMSWSEVKVLLRRYRFVLAGFDVDDTLAYANSNGWWKGGGKIVGGHAMLICSLADDDENWVGMQNSWGEVGHGWQGFVRASREVFDEAFRYGLAWDLRPLK